MGVEKNVPDYATCGYLRQQPRIGPLSRWRWVWDPIGDGRGFPLTMGLGTVSLRTAGSCMKIRGCWGPVSPRVSQLTTSSLGASLCFVSLDSTVVQCRILVRWWIRIGWLAPIGPCDGYYPWWGGVWSRFNSVNITSTTSQLLRHNGGIPRCAAEPLLELRLAAANDRMRLAVST